jgi:hypothetical protein
LERAGEASGVGKLVILGKKHWSFRHFGKKKPGHFCTEDILRSIRPFESQIVWFRGRGNFGAE